MKLEKVTSKRPAGESRTYDDACGAAHALDLVGERWALLVMRELFWGPKRFSDLRASLPGISANVLTQRLEGLEAAGIVVKRKLAPPASVQVYDLTDWGRESEPIFQALGRWASRSPRHDPTKPFSAASLMLSLRTMFDAHRAKTAEARIGFILGNETFVACVGGGTIEIAHDDPAKADVVFTGPPPVIASVIYGGQDLAALESGRALSIAGDRRLAKRFLTWFPLPEKVSL